jgi:TolC family type I secretion outer membrane protein
MRRAFRRSGWAGLALALGLAAPAAAESLGDALREAYATSPRLEAERARLRAIDEQVPQALAGWRPQLLLRSGAGISQESEEVKVLERGGGLGTTRQDETLYQLDARLVLQQPLYSGGGTVADTRRAESAVRAGRAGLAEAEQQLLLATVAAYAGVVRARNVQRSSEDNLDRLRRFEAGVGERFAVAEVTRTDLSQARSRVAGAEADLARAESELEAALAEYERTVGRLPGPLEPARPLAGLPASLDAALALAGGNPRLRQAAFDLEAARAQVRVDTARLLPELNLVGELEHREQPSDDIDQRQAAAVRAEVTIPLYQRGSEHSRVRQAKQTAIQRRYDVADAERGVRREVIRSFEALRAARQQVQALEAQVAAATAALEGVREEAIAGVRTVLDVLDAELELFTARIRRERAREEEVVTSYQLKAAIGELGLAGLGLGDGLYDPEAYYHEVRDRWGGLGPGLDDPAAPGREAGGRLFGLDGVGPGRRPAS